MDPQTESEPGERGQAGRPSAPGPATAWLLFLAFMGSQLCIGGFAGVVIGVSLAVSGRARSAEAVSEVIGPYLVPAAAAGLTMAGGLVFLLARMSWRGDAFRTLGWVGCRAREAFLAAVAGVSIAGLYLVVVLSGWVANPEHVGPLTQAVSGGGWPLHVWAVMALLIAPPVEEFVFRGALLAGFSRDWTTGSAGALVTFLFLGAHFGELTHGPAIAAIAVVGGATLVARVQSGSLVPPVVLHGAYNTVVVAATYVGTA